MASLSLSKCTSCNTVASAQLEPVKAWLWIFISTTLFTAATDATASITSAATTRPETQINRPLSVCVSIFSNLSITFQDLVLLGHRCYNSPPHTQCIAHTQYRSDTGLPSIRDCQDHKYRHLPEPLLLQLPPLHSHTVKSVKITQTVYTSNNVMVTTSC